MSSSIGWVGVVIGIILVLVAIFAGQLGLGGAGLGPKHLVVLVVGIVLIVAGAIVAMRSSSASR